MKWRLILENELNYDVKIIDDKDVLKQYKKEIFNLIQDAYSDKGGFAGADNPRTLIKDTDRAKIVFDSEGKILACALYLVDLGGYKRFGSAGIKGNPESLAAVNAIIKSDIEPYDNWYWVEASGVIEHLFKKNNGNPIPNSLVRYFLDLEEDNPNIRLDEDSTHYFRRINGEWRRKMIFGFKDEESKNMVESVVDDYCKFALGINKMDERINESFYSDIQKMKESRTYLSRLFDFHYSEPCYEAPLDLISRAEESIDFISKHIDIIPKEKKNQYLAAVQRGETCIEDIEPIEFRIFKVSEVRNIK